MTSGVVGVRQRIKDSGKQHEKTQKLWGIVMEQYCELYPQVSAIHELVSIHNDQSMALSALFLQSKTQGSYTDKFFTGSKSGFLKLVAIVNTHLSYVFAEISTDMAFIKNWL